MIDKFLKAKHWQLFILTFGIPLLFQIVIMGSMFFRLELDHQANTEELTDFLTYLPILISFFLIVMFIYTGTIFGWFWSVAIGMQRFIPEELNLRVGRFKFFLLYPLFYILIFISFFIVSFLSGPPNIVFFAIIFPLHLFAMFCMFYCLYFVAKSFKTAELQRKVSFNDYAGEFFLIWFYPIGVWLIQPKVNKMIESKDSNS